MDIQPFKVRVPEETLKDLEDRLTRTRWPDEIPGSGWDYGANLDYVKELVEYWRTKFDWRAQEQLINSFPNYRATVDGFGIHFIQERGKGPNPLPIVVTHGWPGSIFEMYKIIPLLSDPASHGGDPADSFDVIVPSAPGYGFSDRPAKTGMNLMGIADLWGKLMTEGLNYDRFGAHGGDWGAFVTARLGFSYPQNVVGVHVTAVGSRGVGVSPYLGPGSREISEAEEAHFGQWESWGRNEGGYAHEQATKPQTLSYGLNDSPTGLCTWIVEKFRTWSDCNGDVESVYTKDELLTNVMIYWVTQTIGSSTRLYYENNVNPWYLAQGERVEVPTAIAIYPKEIGRPPREWAERSFNVQRWTPMPRGGHFAALETPDLLVNDLREFFRPLR